MGCVGVGVGGWVGGCMFGVCVRGVGVCVGGWVHVCTCVVCLCVGVCEACV